MPGYRPDSEDELEQATIALFGSLGFETKNCFDEFKGGESFLGRDTEAEVVLVKKLRPALEKLNPDLSSEAFDLAIEELTRGRGVMSLAAANREVYKLLKDGVKVTIKNEDGDETVETVKLIDWNNPENNDFGYFFQPVFSCY